MKIKLKGIGNIRMQANAELTQVKAAMMLIHNNDLTCEIHIAGMTIGICNNIKVTHALMDTKEQLEKFLEGKPNNWE